MTIISLKDVFFGEVSLILFTAPFYLCKNAHNTHINFSTLSKTDSLYDKSHGLTCKLNGRYSNHLRQ